MRLKPIAVFLALAIPFFAAAQPGNAVVELSSVNLRSAPSYESSLETQVLMGVSVTVLEKDGYWCHISCAEPRYEGWVTDLCLTRMDGAQLDSYLHSSKYICIAENAHVLERPFEEAQRVSDLVMGDLLVKCLSLQGLPIRSGKYLKVALPSGKEGYVHKACLTDYAAWRMVNYGTGEDVAALARRFVGVPYLWGGNTVNGFDCSGLVWLCYHMNGIELPRNASAQAREGEAVALDALQPGDLVFYGRAASEEKPMAVTHVAIYLGGNSIVQASQLVRINSLDPTAPDYYKRTPLFARRIIAR